MTRVAGSPRREAGDIRAAMTNRFGPYARWLWHGVPPGVDPSPDDLEAYQASSARKARFDVLALSALIQVANLGYWVTDPWIFSDADAFVEPITTGRLRLALLGAAAFLVAWRLPRATYAVGAVGGWLSMWVLARAMSDCGPPSGPWMNFTLPYFLLPIGVSVRPLTRVVMTVGLMLALFLGYFGSHPEYAADPLAAMGLAHLAYVAALGWVLGVLAERARLLHFLTRRALHQERAALADEVRHQTRAVVELSRRLDAAREAERAELARDLHDDLAQTLTATRLLASHALGRYQKDPASAGASLELVRDGLDELTEQTRRLLSNIRPMSVDDRSLGAALDALARRTAEITGVSVTYEDAASPISTSTARAMVVWRAAQELLTNLARHADARTASVRLSLDGDRLVLDVTDDGRGFDASADTIGLGLLGVRERVASVDGDVEVHSAPGAGARFRVSIPLEGP
jgi:signal transduction histidine kinase